MNRLAMLVGVPILALASFVRPATAQIPGAPAQTLDTEISAEVLRLPPRFQLGFTSESGGTPASLDAFDGFFPFLQTPGHALFYVNPRIRFDFDGEDTIGGNILFGYRTYSRERERILGGYVGLDVRDTGESTFPQIGFGFERLARRWDIRAKGYVPVGDTRQRTDTETLSESTTPTGLSGSLNPTFQGNFLLSGFSQTSQTEQVLQDRFEAALGGFDVEAGTQLVSFGESGELRLGGGVYYLAGNDVSAIGGRGRLSLVPVDPIHLSVGIQGDAVFDTRVFFNASFQLPNPPSITTDRDPEAIQQAVEVYGPVVQRLNEPLQRVHNVVVDEQLEQRRDVVPGDPVPLFFLNPETGEPYFFNFVAPDDLAGSALMGTFEDPVGTIADALAEIQGAGNDVIFVQLGEDTTFPGFTIPSGVRVLSSGPEQDLPALLPNSPFNENVVLPGSNSGERPNIDGTVVLADGGSDQILSGFEVTNSSGQAGILGRNNIDPLIEFNTVTINAPALATGLNGRGIVLEGSSGITQVLENRVEGAVGQGIFLNDAVDSVVVSNNTVVSPIGTGISLTSSGNSTTDFIIDGNTVMGDSMLTTSSGLSIEIGNPDPADNSSTATANISINGGTYSEINGNGIDIHVLDNTIVNATLSNVNLTDNVDFGFEATTENNGELNILFTSLFASDNTNSGLSLTSFNDSGLFASVLGSTFTNNPSFGVAVTSNDNSLTCVQLSDNTSSGSALGFLVFGNSSLPLQSQDGPLANSEPVTAVGNITTVTPPASFIGCTVPSN